MYPLMGGSRVNHHQNFYIFHLVKSIGLKINIISVNFTEKLVKEMISNLKTHKSRDKIGGQPA